MITRHENLITSVLSLLGSDNKSTLFSCLGCILSILMYLSNKNPDALHDFIDSMMDAGAYDALENAEDPDNEEINDMIDKIRNIIESQD